MSAQTHKHANKKVMLQKDKDLKRRMPLLCIFIKCSKLKKRINLLMAILFEAAFTRTVKRSVNYPWQVCIITLTLTLILFRQPQSRCLVRQLTQTMTP